MLKRLSFVIVISAVCIAIVEADDVTGKVKSAKSENKVNTLVISVPDDKDATKSVDKTFTVPAEAQIYTTILVPKGKAKIIGKKKAAPAIEENVILQFSDVLPGATVTVTTAKKDDKESVTAVKVGTTGSK